MLAYVTDPRNFSALMAQPSFKSGRMFVRKNIPFPKMSY